MIQEAFLIAALSLPVANIHTDSNGDKADPGFTKETFIREYKWLEELMKKADPTGEFMILPEKYDKRPAGWTEVPIRWRGHIIYRRPKRITSSAMALRPISFTPTSKTKNLLTVEGLLANDPDQWERVRKKFIIIATKRGRNESDAQDIAQESCVSLMQCFARGANIWNLNGFLEAICQNVMLQGRVRFAKAKEYPLDLWTSVDVSKVANKLSIMIAEETESIQKEALAYGIASLSAQGRKLISLYFEDFTFDEIAIRLNLSHRELARSHYYFRRMIVKNAQVYLARSA